MTGDVPGPMPAFAIPPRDFFQSSLPSKSNAYSPADSKNA